MSGQLHIPDGASVRARLRHHKAWIGSGGHEYPPRALVHIYLDNDGLVLTVEQAEQLRDALTAALNPTGGAR